MPSIAKYRKTWFALLKEAGIPEEDRHWIQEEYTGKESTTEWKKSDWRKAIAQMQQRLGQHHDSYAHVREDRNGGVSKESGDRATSAQCNLIEALADEIDWKAGREKGPIAYLAKSSLKGPSAGLRRTLMRKHYDQELRGDALWSKLDRKEAADFIRALKSLKARQQDA